MGVFSKEDLARCLVTSEQAVEFKEKGVKIVYEEDGHVVNAYSLEGRTYLESIKDSDDE